MKSNTHKENKIKIIKKCTIESFNQVFRSITFSDYGYFNDVDIAYTDSIQRITPVTNKIAPFRENFKASRFNIDERLYEEAKINI